VVEVVPAGCRSRFFSTAPTRNQESYVVRVGGRLLWPMAALRRRK
jgi:hypothetical protein